MTYTLNENIPDHRGIVHPAQLDWDPRDIPDYWKTSPAGHTCGRCRRRYGSRDRPDRAYCMGRAGTRTDCDCTSAGSVDKGTSPGHSLEPQLSQHIIIITAPHSRLFVY